MLYGPTCFIQMTCILAIVGSTLYGKSPKIHQNHPKSTIELDDLAENDGKKKHCPMLLEANTNTLISFSSDMS